MDAQNALQALLPIVGVLLGWTLSQIGTAAQRRTERKRTLGRAVLHLLHRRDELKRVNAMFAGVRKLRSDRVAVEAHRRHMVEKHFGGERPFEAGIKALTETIAAFDPVLAFEIAAQADDLKSLLKIEAPSLAQLSPDLYDATFELIQSGNAIMLRKTDAALRKLSFRQGIVKYVLMRLWLRRRSGTELEQWGDRTRQMLEAAGLDSVLEKPDPPTSAL